VKKLLDFFSKEADKLNSMHLSALVLKMKEDHFVKVRGMIKDMVAKLEADAASEADQKSWCDDEMKKATEARDEAIANMEGDLASKTSAESKIAKLKEEIQELLTEISELTKALNEATELRAMESKDNAKTLADATAGLAGVKKAMKILKDFYDNAFIQTHKKYVPPKADASGNTVGDLAPSTFEGEMHGNQDAAVGIIGQLGVITSDFEGTIDATKASEEEASGEFDTYKSDTETDISEKESSVKSKTGEKDTETANLSDYTDDLSDHTTDKAQALQELAKLKPACVDTGSDYAEQVARRNQEIESLKNAYVILDEMR
jgi:chromosome segregation ATPase